MFVEHGILVDHLGKGNVDLKSHVHCLFHQNEFCMEALLLMGLLEFLEDQVSHFEFACVIIILLRNVTKEKSFERFIIGASNVVSSGVRCFVRLGEGTIEPLTKTLAGSQEVNTTSPECPVAEINVQLEVGGPGIVVDVLFSVQHVIRSNSRDGCCCLRTGGDGGSTTCLSSVGCDERETQRSQGAKIASQER